jgi:hypothetical protein
MFTLRNKNLTLYTAPASHRRLPSDLLTHLLAAIAILMLVAGNILAARLCSPWHWKAPSFRLVSVGPAHHQVHRETPQ